MKTMTIFIRVFIIVLVMMSYSVSNAAGGNDGPDIQSSNFTLNSKELSFDDMNRLVDRLLQERKETHVDADKLTNDLLDKIYDKREKNKKKASIVLLKMYQYSDAEDSEFITQMLNELFYFHPKMVADALDEIKAYLLIEHQNQKYIDYLIQSACGIPQIITENPSYSDAMLSKDARDILFEIKGMDIDQTLKDKIISIVQKWAGEI